MAKKYLSNIRLTNYYPDEVVVTPINIQIVNHKDELKLGTFLIKTFREYDGLLVLNPSFEWILRGAAYKILSFSKKKIVFFDMLLPCPNTFSDYMRAYIKKRLLILVDKFIFLHKDISGYLLHYGIKKEKCFYIPFKANNIDQVSKYEVGDDGYLLSCGASYRDYILLARALEYYPCRTVVLLPEKRLADYHNSVIDESLFGDNVQILRHDFNKDTWNRILSRCRAMVLPIRSDSVQCAGLSVYLEAMAFGKPVIITEGPATRGLLTEVIAAICPPDNPKALAKAIKRVWEDEAYRSKLGENGLIYSHALGGEDRLVKNVLRTLIEM